MSNLPKVSIITVCYNSEKTLEQTIQSVLAQDYPFIEYVVIDGSSNDSSLEIINKYKSQIAHFVSEPDKGIYDAMNKGIALATGDVVGMLNSDDFYLSASSVSFLINELIKNDTDSVFADLIIVDPNDTKIIKRYYDSSSWSPKRFRYGWMPAHPTFFIKKKYYDQHGVFSLNYKIASDFDMLIRLLYKGKASYTYLAKPVIMMRMGGASTKGLINSFKLNCEIVKACRSHGVWTNLILVMLKIPAKLYETISWRWKYVRGGRDN